MTSELQKARRRATWYSASLVLLGMAAYCVAIGLAETITS